MIYLIFMNRTSGQEAIKKMLDVAKKVVPKPCKK